METLIENVGTGAALVAVFIGMLSPLASLTKRVTFAWQTCSPQLTSIGESVLFVTHMDGPANGTNILRSWPCIFWLDKSVSITV